MASASGDDYDDDDAAASSKRQRFTETPTPPPSDPHAPPSPTLPFELIAEILQWVPTKRLLQLQCTCKSWQSLISDPQFAKKHLRLPPKPARLILTFASPTTREFVIRSYPLHNVFDAAPVGPTELRYPSNRRKRFDLIVGSCDGILCFAVNQSLVLLWNPCIRKFKTLPPLNNQHREGSYTIFGFGYDSFSACYKVVAVFSYECDADANGYKSEVKVLTLGTESWRVVPDFPSVVPLDESGKFVSGSVNWLAYKSSPSSVIVSLDLQKECFEEVLQPDYGDVAVLDLTLGVLRHRLCVIAHGYDLLDVWLMQDYGNRESWTKLFSFPFLETPDSFPWVKALSLSEDDQLLLEFGSKLVVYNTRDGTFDTPQIQDINDCLASEVYIESLISPCS
ncbi:hypothetical protein Fmac_009157 [Flemingia macrophylla]|uniref:F-box domain-containing protein n=1 Tax=Flemingia macrophylla TaxID=520843 RepID=A0ABD1MZG2_9FABA